MLCDPFSGEHCETVTVGTLLQVLGVCPSEAMLFGLGRGLSFFEAQDSQMRMPMLAGRIAPGLIAENLADACGLTMRSWEGSPSQAWQQLEKQLAAGRPVAAQVDCYYLEYFRTKIHFGGHFVAIVGLDDSSVYLADTQSQGGLCKTSRESFVQAWEAKEAPLARPWYGFVLGGNPCMQAHAVEHALEQTLKAFWVEAVPRLRKTAEQMPDCLQSPTAREDAARCAKLIERGGTGGANFRKLFADFLDEASLGTPAFRAQWRAIQSRWHTFAQALERFDREAIIACIRGIADAEQQAARFVE